MITDYAEFNDARLAEVYDFFCPLGKDSNFFLNEVKKAKPKVILDVGCGSGILTVELAKVAQEVIGVEPASPMIDIARRRPGGENVNWVHGYVKDVADIHIDVAIMTSHVAQFFLNEDDWESTLRHLHDLLNSGGKLIFDSRNPLVKPWLSWSKATTQRSASTPYGTVVMWYELLSAKQHRVQYQLHYKFNSDDELVSNNELVYRSKEDISHSLKLAGFEVENVYGDWDGSIMDEESQELIFVARKL